MAKPKEARQLPEFDKTDPWDYKAPEGEALVLDLPARLFVRIEGKGAPSGEEFSHAVGALYGFSYAVRMSYRSADAPAGAGAYKVGLLQGQWSIADIRRAYDPSRKENLVWTVMIRQPDFLDLDLFQRFRDEARAKAKKKKEVDPAIFDRLGFGMADSGRFAQILHRGSYDDEPAAFARLEADLKARGMKRASKDHREIYLGDPGRVAPEKLRTILRVAIA